MKIERIDENPVTPFGNIAPGTVFRDFDDVYMKIHSFSDKVNNAVRLRNGECARFSDYEEITLLTAKVVIK